MTARPEFSVVIPTYNRLDFLKLALETVWTQTFEDYEVIVVDDGSSDGTSEWLAAQGPRLQVVSQNNRGPGAARNLGAGHALGKYLAFLDSDDLWFPWTLEIYRGLVSNINPPSFIAGCPRVFSDPQELNTVAGGAVQTERFSDYLSSGDLWRWWGVSSFIILRDAFSAVGGFVEDYVNGEDADLALRLGDAPGFVQVIAPVTFAYREHARSAMKDVNRTLAGARLMVRTEEESCYPGGPARVMERRRIITRHIRPVAISCLQNGLWREAWELYGSTFTWNASLGRLKYLTGFPLVALAEAIRPKVTTPK